jgi:hypothetical protein
MLGETSTRRRGGDYRDGAGVEGLSARTALIVSGLGSGLPNAGDEENDPFERMVTAFNESKFNDLLPHTGIVRR